MAKPRHRLIPISRDVAEGLVVDARPPAGGEEGPKAGRERDVVVVRTLIAILSRASAIAPEGDEILERDIARTDYVTGLVAYDRLHMGMAALRQDLGRIGRMALRTSVSRASRMLVGLRGEPAYGWSEPMRHKLLSVYGNTSRMGPPTVGAVDVERTLLAAATGGIGQAIWVDTRALRRFRCRYSPVAYLRCLAWLERPPAGAKPAARTGKLWWEIPYAEAQDALGLRGMPVRGTMTRTVLEPVMRELAEVGVDLTLKWKDNYRGEPVALRIGLASTEASRTAALAERSREDAAARQARMAARRARRREAIRRDGSSIAALGYRYQRRRPPAP